MRQGWFAVQETPLRGWIQNYSVTGTTASNTSITCVRESGDYVHLGGFIIAFSQRYPIYAKIEKSSGDIVKQEVWNRQYGFITSIDVDSSGNAYAVMASLEYGGTGGSSITKFDATTHDRVWTRIVYDSDNYVEGYHIRVNPASDAFYVVYRNGQNSAIAKYNMSNTQVWRREIRFPTGTFYFYGLEVVYDTTADKDYIYAVGDIVWKIDEDGNNIWQQDYSMDFVDCVPVSTTADSGIYAVGTTSSGTYGSAAMLMKINADGSINYQKIYDLGTSTTTERNYSVAQHSSGDLIIYMYSSSGSPSTVMRVDPADGSIDWINRITGNPDSAINLEQDNLDVDDDYVYVITRAGSTPTTYRLPVSGAGQGTYTVGGITVAVADPTAAVTIADGTQSATALTRVVDSENFTNTSTTTYSILASGPTTYEVSILGFTEI